MQFGAYDESSPGAGMLKKAGFKQSIKRLGTGRNDVMRTFSHPEHGTIHHFSNGSWEHYNHGELKQEGRSHIDLGKHLQSLSSQHSEQQDGHGYHVTADQAEQLLTTSTVFQGAKRR